MQLTTRELIPLAIGYLGCWGGVIGTIVWWQIIDLLNTRRPPEDQIPAAIVTYKDFIKYYPLPVWRHVRDFHRQFPESRLYFWYWASLAWLFTLGLTSIVLLMIV
jgi:hypothetical protein